MLENLIQEVDRLSAEGDAPEDVDTFIRSFALIDDELRIQLELRSNYLASSAWVVETQGMRGFEFSHLWGCDLPELVTEHPALLRFSEPESVLHFRGSSPSPLAILGALYQQHLSVVGDWLRFSDGVSTSMFSTAPWLKEHGIVATGPVSVLESYKSVLESYGLLCSIPPGRAPGRFRDGKWDLGDIPVKCLLIGSNWVVAESFVAALESGPVES